MTPAEYQQALLGALHAHLGPDDYDPSAGTYGGRTISPPMPGGASPTLSDPSPVEQPGFLTAEQLGGVNPPPPVPQPGMLPLGQPGPLPRPPAVPLRQPFINDPINAATSSGEGSVSTSRLSPRQEENLAAQGANSAAQERAIRAGGDVNIERAKIDANQAAELAGRAPGELQRYADTSDRAQRAVDAAQARQSQVEAKWSAAKFQDFWANRSTADRIAASMYIGMGDFVSRFVGGRNTALDAIDSAVTQDFAQQKASVDKLKDQVVMARTGIQDAEQAKARMLNDLALREAAARDQIVKAAEQKRASLRVPEAIASADKLIADQRDKALALRATALHDEAQKYDIKQGGTVKTEDSRMIPQVPGVPMVYDPKTGKPIGTLPQGMKGSAPELAVDQAYAEKLANALDRAAAHIEEKGAAAGLGEVIGSETYHQRSRLFGDVERILAQAPKGSARFSKEYVDLVKKQAGGLGTRQMQLGAGADEMREAAARVREDVQADLNAHGFQATGTPEAAPEKPAHGHAAPQATAGPSAGEIAKAKAWAATHPGTPQAERIRKLYGE